MKYRILAKDISCEHCKKAIEDEFKTKGYGVPKIDVPNQTVEIETEKPAEEVLAVMKNIGYPGSVI